MQQRVGLSSSPLPLAAHEPYHPEAGAAAVGIEPLRAGKNVPKYITEYAVTLT
jgi:hypothetical protein